MSLTNSALSTTPSKSKIEQQLRDALVIGCLPAAVTIVSHEGRILHQNPQSKLYYGDRVSDTSKTLLAHHQPEDILALLFAVEPMKLFRLQETLEAQGSTGLWKAVVRVPPSLDPAYLGTHRGPPETGGLCCPGHPPQLLDEGGGASWDAPCADQHAARPAPAPADADADAAAVAGGAAAAAAAAAGSARDPARSKTPTGAAEAAAAAELPGQPVSTSTGGGGGGGGGARASRPGPRGGGGGSDSRAPGPPPDSSPLVADPSSLPATACLASATMTTTGGFPSLSSSNQLALSVPAPAPHGTHAGGGGGSCHPSGASLHMYDHKCDTNTTSNTTSFSQHEVPMRMSGGCGLGNRGIRSAISAATKTGAFAPADMASAGVTSAGVAAGSAAGTTAQQRLQMLGVRVVTRTQLGAMGGASFVQSVSSVDRAAGASALLSAGGSGVHDPFATSTFATLVSSPTGPVGSSSRAANASSPVYGRAPVVPSGSRSGSRIIAAATLHGTISEGTGVENHPSRESAQAAPNDGPPPAATARRPAPQRRTVSFYATSGSRVMPTINSGCRSSSASTNNSRALTFALSLGTSPLMATTPMPPPPPPQLVLPPPQLLADVAEPSVADDGGGGTTHAAAAAFQPAFRSLTLGGIRAPGCTVGTASAIFRRSSLSRFTTERLKWVVGASPSSQPQAGVAAAAAAAAAQPAAEVASGTCPQSPGACVVPVAVPAAAGSADWNSFVAGSQIQEEAVYSEDGPMFGLPFGSPDHDAATLVSAPFLAANDARSGLARLAAAALRTPSAVVAAAEVAGAGGGGAGGPAPGGGGGDADVARSPLQLSGEIEALTVESSALLPASEAAVGVARWRGALSPPPARGSAAEPAAAEVRRTQFLVVHSGMRLEEKEGEPDDATDAAAAAAAESTAASVAALAAAKECWHEVWASSMRDPVAGQQVLVLTQTDVTSKVIAERHLALVMETEHRLVEQLFPRHILQYITEEWTAAAGVAEAQLATAGDLTAVPAAAAAAAAGGTGPSVCKQQQRQQPRAGIAAGENFRWRPVIRDCTSLATTHSEVTLLFADIKGFTPMCNEVEPRQTMTLLNELYSRYDALLDKYGVYKVETIGDCYFVAGGLITEDEDGMAAVCDRSSRSDPQHAEKVFGFAKAMLCAARQVCMPTTGGPVEIRVGLHTGPVVSGVVGTRMPRFCLFGDTVNTASRMESTGVPGAVHASEATLRRLPASLQAQWKSTGGIEVKGKGLMQTYLWTPPPTTNTTADAAAATAPAASAAPVSGEGK